MNKRFEKDPISKLLIEFSIPAIMGSLIVMLYSVVDKIFIGQRLGAEALAGVTLIYPFSLISISLGGLIGVGGGTLVSIKLGEGKIKECNHITGNQITLFLISCSIITIIQQIFLMDILKSMGGSGEALSYAVTYGRIFIPVIFFQCFTYGLNGVVRAHGFPKFAMTTSFIGAILNIGLDYIFLYPLDMGVFGAGLATFISLAIAATFNVWFFLSRKFPTTIKLHHLKLKKSNVLSILKLGSSAGLITFSNAIVATVFNWQLNKFSGPNAVAAYGIYMTVHSLVIMMILGIAQGGMQPIIGYNLGAKNYSRIIETIKLTLLSTGILSAALMGIVQFFPKRILHIFIDDPSTVEIGTNALRLGFSVVPAMIITIVIAGIYQALGEAKIAFFFNFMRKVAMIVPAILILPSLIGINGVWLTRPVSDVVSCLIMLFYFKNTIKELRAK